MHVFTNPVTICMHLVMAGTRIFASQIDFAFNAGNIKIIQVLATIINILYQLHAYRLKLNTIS